MSINNQSYDDLDFLINTYQEQSIEEEQREAEISPSRKELSRRLPTGPILPSISIVIILIFIISFTASGLEDLPHNSFVVTPKIVDETEPIVFNDSFFVDGSGSVMRPVQYLGNTPPGLNPSDLLMYEDFEGATTLADGALQSSDSYIDNTISFSGSHSLNMCAGEGCKFSERMYLPEEVEKAYARYMFRVGNHEAWYDSNGNPYTGEHYKNPGLEGGDSSCKGGGSHTDANCIAARTRLNNPNAGMHLEGWVSYGIEGDGSHSMLDKTINVVDGEWHCLEIMVKLNTPGKSDGEAKIWVDDRETAYRGLDYRKDKTWKISKYWWTYWSNDNWKGPIYLDDVIVSKSRIGCPGGAPTPTFVDVPFDHWAHDYIEVLYQNGYVAGCSSEPLLYCPDKNLDRAEGAVFLERGIHGAGHLPPQPADQVFADVPLAEWYSKWANALWNDGFTAGCGTDPLIFCPMQGHTRAEASVYVLRVLHGADYVPPPPTGLFSDAPASAWYAKWVEAAYQDRLIPPCDLSPGFNFCPNDLVTRADMAMFLSLALRLDVESPPFPQPPTAECANWQVAHPEWIFCDDFEVDAPMVGMGRYFEFDDDGGDFSRMESIGVNGSYGMRVLWQQGEVGAGSLKVAFGRNPNGYMNKTQIRPNEDFREVYYRMYLKMQDGWQGNPGKLSRATIFPSSSDWSQAMIAHLWGGRGNALALDPVRCVDENSNVKCIGYNDFAHMDWLGLTHGTFPIFDTANSGNWYCVEAHVRLNDPGQSNGLQEFWIDGNLDARVDGLNFVRNFTDYGINAIFFENYWNSGSVQPQERYFDNIVISTEPVGCLP
ncbi:MAG: hypothetical protein GTO18_12335 [Anaerolineales bacterium]|nr:hypothetical protein [Anaerolineales bacterium]